MFIWNFSFLYFVIIMEYFLISLYRFKFRTDITTVHHGGSQNKRIGVQFSSCVLIVPCTSTCKHLTCGILCNIMSKRKIDWGSKEY